MAGASFTPDLLWEDPYFDERQPLTRRERVLWIAANVRRVDNCVVMKGEGAWSLRFLSDAWKCPKTNVERFLKKCEKLGILVLKKCKINGTVQYVISYVFSTLSAFDQKKSGQQPGQERDRSGTNFKSEDGSKKKEHMSAKADPFFPEEEGQQSAGPEPEASQPKAEKPKKSPPNKKAKIEPDWVPAEKTVEWCRAEGLTDEQIKRTVEEFVEYWLEAGNKRPGWDRTFKSRVSTLKDMGRFRSKPAYGRGRFQAEPEIY